MRQLNFKYLPLILILIISMLAIIGLINSSKDRLDIFADCASSQNTAEERMSCIHHWLKSNGNPSNIDESLTAIYKIYDQGKIGSGQCHVYEHVAAMAAFETNGKDVSAILNVCDNRPTCGGACYHATLEEGVNAAGITDLTLDQFSKICDKRTPQRIGECYHGIGHGLVVASSYNLNESFISCDKLSQDPQKRIECYTGVVMKGTRPDLATGEHPPYFSTTDPLYPCSEVADPYKPICYSYSSERAIAAGKSVEEAAQVCTKLEKSEWQAACRIEVYRAIVRRKTPLDEKKASCSIFGENTNECLNWLTRPNED